MTRSLFFGLVFAFTLLLGACGGKSGQIGQCVPVQSMYEAKVIPVLNQHCASCHSWGGSAPREGSQFQIVPDAFPGFMDSNFNNLSEMARYKVDGNSVILAKATNSVPHKGGKVLGEDSEEYKTLQQLVADLEKDERCVPSNTSDPLFHVGMASAQSTFRNAAIHINGRVPTDQEMQALGAAQDPEAALAEHISELLEEPAFYARLIEIFNDLLLSEKYRASYNGVMELMGQNLGQFPAYNELIATCGPDGTSNETRLPCWERYEYGFAREPLELIAHIARNNRPFTEIVTAPYTLVNPYSAKIYGVTNVKFKDASDIHEWHEAKLKPVGVKLNDARSAFIPDPEVGTVAWPHAGVLTTVPFLSRFPTTPTNLNRHRARTILKIFLDTDILGLPERALESSAGPSYPNPTRDNPNCVSCHQIIDPIAGAFRAWDHELSMWYRPKAENHWPINLFPPGYQSELMPSEPDKGPQWLGERLAKDPRFPLAMVRHIYRALTGMQPLPYPATGSEHYEAKLAAWRSQNKRFQDMAAKFVAENYNIKTVFRELLTSPLYRGVIKKDLPEPIAQYQGLLRPNRIQPEALVRKIKAVTNFEWSIQQYNITFGGIDSDNVIDRVRDTNSVMENIASRMAGEVACGITANEWTVEPKQRTLLTKVSSNDVAGDAVINTLKHLYWRFQGKQIDVEDPDFKRVYDLFVQVQRAGSKAVTAGQETTYVPGCVANAATNPTVVQDANYAARAWIAVLAYFIADYTFLYEVLE